MPGARADRRAVARTPRANMSVPHPSVCTDPIRSSGCPAGDGLPDPVEPSAWSVGLRYGLALAAIAAVVVVSRLLWPGSAWMPLLPAIAAVGWFCGAGPALLALVLAALAQQHYATPAVPITAMLDSRGASGTILFSLVAAGVAAPAVWARRTVAELRHARSASERSADAMRASEARFRAIAEQAESGVAMTDRDGRFVFVNDRCCRMLARSRETLLAGTVEQVMHPEDWVRNLPRVARVLTHGESFIADNRYRRPDGSVVWMRDSVGGFRSADGSLQGVLAISIDITERQAADEALRRSEATLGAVLDALPVGVAIVDTDGRIVRENAASRTLWGVPPAVADGAPHGDRVGWWPATGARIGADEWALARALATGETVRDELVECRCSGDGERRASINHAAPVHDAEGRLLGAVGVAIDVTGRLADERRVRDSELLLRRVLDNLFAFVGVMTPDGTLIEANRAPLEAAGITAADVCGRKFWDCHWWSYAPDVQARVRDAVDRANRREVVRFDVQVRMAGDSRLWIDFQLAPLVDDDGRIAYLVPSAIDLSARRDAERALRDSEARFRLVVASASLGTFDHDMTTGLVELSVAAQRIYDVDRVLLPLSQVLERLHPEDAEATRAVMAGAADPSGDGEYRIRYRLVHRGGGVRWVDVVGRVEFAPQPDGSRRPVRRAGVIWDITEQQRLVEGLQRADRAKDEFLAMLGHELRNPLAPVINSLRLLDRTGPMTEVGRRAVAMIDRQTRHMKRLVDDLLEVSRITRGKIELRPEPLSIGSAIHGAVDTVGSQTLQRGQRIEMVLPQTPVRIVADPVRLAQILENLLMNASKYTHAGGSIRIEARDRPDEVEIRVVDDGIGIAPDQIPNLFEMFRQLDSTLDRAQGGLGIGLAMVKRLAELHGGRVSAHSEGLGRGSTFTVVLPHRCATVAAPPG